MHSFIHTNDVPSSRDVCDGLERVSVDWTGVKNRGREQYWVGDTKGEEKREFIIMVSVAFSLYSPDDRKKQQVKAEPGEKTNANDFDKWRRAKSREWGFNSDWENERKLKIVREKKEKRSSKVFFAEK